MRGHAAALSTEQGATGAACASKAQVQPLSTSCVYTQGLTWRQAHHARRRPHAWWEARRAAHAPHARWRRRRPATHHARRPATHHARRPHAPVQGRHKAVWGEGSAGSLCAWCALSVPSAV